MNWDIIQGKWQQFKGTVKEKWGDLTDDEIDQIDGNREKLSGKLQEKYGWAKEDAERHIDDLFRDKS
ncbi:CsbD family protein [Paracoccus methylarcula]|uniref:CsbD family protein n=1 Tax=Paracoccus methylarcula TaxID=72022 RepID=A0A422QSL7_9RHOB|nr:CsbD family protein [Paracoccus methylarcula]RNF32963.1 CsbD family protein [Paracoccus methylarcula]